MPLTTALQKSALFDLIPDRFSQTEKRYGSDRSIAGSFAASSKYEGSL
jgi:hypothetical protein